jgi:hypothetical protein
MLLVCAAALSVQVTVGCAARRGSWSNGWYSEALHFKGPGGQQTLQLRYRPGELPASWQLASAPPGDVAFYNPDRGATMYSDSSCASRYEDAPLAVLLNHLLFGFTEVETVSEEEATLADRAALLRVASARLDGVPVQLAATVTKNGPCVFDLVYVGPPHSFEGIEVDYRAFVRGLEVEFLR